MRATCEDGFGVALESSVIPVAVGWPSHRFNRRQLDEFLELIYPEIRARVEDAAVEWRERTARLTGAFLDVRLAREHAIGAASDAIVSTFQAGLFDRRAERENAAQRDVASDLKDDANRRIAWIDQARRLSMPPPELLLVLAP